MVIWLLFLHVVDLVRFVVVLGLGFGENLLGVWGFVVFKFWRWYGTQFGGVSCNVFNWPKWLRFLIFLVEDKEDVGDWILLGFNGMCKDEDDGNFGLFFVDFVVEGDVWRWRRRRGCVELEGDDFENFEIEEDKSFFSCYRR